MPEPHFLRRPSPPPDRDRSADPRLALSWRLLGGAIAFLGVLSIIRLATGAEAGDWLIALLALAAAVAAVATRRLVDAMEAGRQAEARSFQRILSGLSRSVSPDAIVSAIIEELGVATDADHIVVARRRPGGRLLEATLVAPGSGLPVSQTILPVTDLDDPELAAGGSRAAIAAGRGRRFAAIPIEADASGGRPAEVGVAVMRPQGISPHAVLPPDERDRAASTDRAGGRRAHAVPVRDGAPDRIARRIAGRVRDVYGLKHTLAAPLRIDGRVEGAIVLSRRTAGPWPPRARRLLGAAAVEASAALARAYSHRAAEARASTDALTGLPNRRYFDEYVALLARRRRADDRVGVLMVDVDRFKKLNDTYGHAVGDHVLRAVATAIGRTVREDDVPARFGGEEFIVLLRNPTPDVAFDVAERIRRAVAALDLRGLGVPSVSVSVGVAVASRPEIAIDTLIEEADRALYRAKRAGRDRVVAA
ncbi:MAG TPA: GGDEF domain-containing protein [Candidatus Limnocylindrales bacterium]|nr:GGDEF domain-containing protein [Candidatus Limnocylindrales bacterium]